MQNPEIIARKITEMIVNESFRLFRDKKFRNLCKLETFEQVEQDRIFNEIVVSGLALSILMFESLAELNRGKKQDLEQLYLNLKLEMTSCYGNWLKELGTEQKFVDIWKELIEMRCAEYRKNKEKYLKHMNIEKNPWQHIVSIGGFDHITRGKGKPEDELFQIFIHWVNKISNQIVKTMLNS